MAKDNIAPAHAPTEAVPPPRRVSISGRIFGSGPLNVIKRTLTFLVVFLTLYYGVLGNWMHRIDANLNFVPPNPVIGGSEAINMAEALILRETVVHRWSPNDQIFFPTGLLDNMPNFQRGMLRAISRFIMEFENQVARVRGSSAIDRDLERATGLVQFPTDTWFFDLEQSLMPIQPAESQYIAAARSLRSFNERVVARAAVFERRADAMAIVVERMGSELGARTALIDEHTSGERFIFDTGADDIFYFNKGMTYATYLLLRELRTDFSHIVSNQNLERVMDQALASLREAARQQPLIVLNSAGATSLFANHLQLQGFYMKRAILQLDEISRAIRAN